MTQPDPKELSARAENQLNSIGRLYPLVERPEPSAYEELWNFLPDRDRPQVGANLRFNGVSHWRTGFLSSNPAQPFLYGFGLLDTVVEWLLNAPRHKVSKFANKSAALKSMPESFPDLLLAHPWLRLYLPEIYTKCYPIRNTLEHAPGDFRVNGASLDVSLRNKAGERRQVEPNQSRALSTIAFVLTKCLDQSWKWNAYLENTVRWAIDELQSLHELESLRAHRPSLARARLYFLEASTIALGLPVVLNQINAPRQIPLTVGSDAGKTILVQHSEAVADIEAVVLSESVAQTRTYLVPFDIVPPSGVLELAKLEDRLTTLPIEVDVGTVRASLLARQ